LSNYISLDMNLLLFACKGMHVKNSKSKIVSKVSRQS